MIRSMTGFGRGQTRFRGGKVTIEIKTVNHKFFDATLKLPNNISIFEDEIKDVLEKRIKRGKVNLNLIYDGAFLKDEKIAINREAAKNYYTELIKLSRHLGIKPDIDAKDIIAMPGVLHHEPAEEDLARFWPKIKATLEKALDNLIYDREKEGKAIYADLSRRSKRISKFLVIIKSRTSINLEEYKKRFAERVKDLTGGREIDRGRLEMEVAIFAKNSDISEEITRLKNHISNFNQTISTNGEIGKKVDFIAQELHREANTIGSKSGDFKISKSVIEIKGEIEKIREQAKNLE